MVVSGLRLFLCFVRVKIRNGGKPALGIAAWTTVESRYLYNVWFINAIL